MISKHKKALGASLLAVVLLTGAASLAWPSDDASVPALPTLQAGATSEPVSVFEGRVPCGDYCERIKVRLTLHRNPATNAPAEYVLERIYVGRGNDRTTTRGTWRSLDLPKLYGAPAIQLDDASPAEFGTYLQVGDVLLFLTADLQPRVGDAAHSFTLSRTR
jgi:hypothetical protein